jgi:hypothetical protein
MCRRIQATTTKGYTKFEDAKGVIRNRKSRKDRQDNEQRERTNNERQNITLKTTD